MKPFTIASTLLFAASLSGVSAIPSPQTGAPDPAKPLAPPTPLSDFQQPIVLPNGVECIAASLVMNMDEGKPDETFPKVRQMGPNVFVAMDFNSTHAGKNCRFHFTLSGLADASNGKGAEEIYPIKSGAVDEKLTFNNQPTLFEHPIASFAFNHGSFSAGITPSIEFYPANFKSNFTCPTTRTGWAVRSANGAMANWSWNKGLIVEVLGDKPWVHGELYVNGKSAWDMK